jgi:O-antigen/teichoic acid export membrane protein
MADASEARMATERPASVGPDSTQPVIPGDTPVTDFKGKSVRGGAATVIGQGMSMALQTGSTVILARLLSPTDYGLQGMVFTLTGFFSLFKDAGLSVASVQRRDLTHDQISTLFWINVAVGTFLTLVVASMGPLLVIFYKEPRLLGITFVSASVFLLNSLSVQHRALLDRSLRFATTAKVDVLALAISAAVGITMAVLGFGYWALVGQAVAAPLAGMTGVWIAMPWRPGRPRRSSGVRSMMRFGGTVTLNSLVVYLAYNTEKVLLGRFWGPAALGIYGRAYQLANLPVQQMINAVGAVAFPVLSRMQSDADRVRRSFMKAHSLVVSMTIPVVISCAVFANEIVRVVLGPKWTGTATVLRLLAPTVLVFALVNPFSWFLRATGRVVRSLKIALMLTPVVILGVVAGLRHGPPGVAMGYSGAMLLLLVPLVVWAKYKTGITTADYLNSIWRPLLAGTLAGAAGASLRFALHSALKPIPMLALGLAVSFAVYAGLLLFVMGQKDFYLDLLRHLLRRNQQTASAKA